MERNDHCQAALSFGLAGQARFCPLVISQRMYTRERTMFHDRNIIT